MRCEWGMGWGGPGGGGSSGGLSLVSPLLQAAAGTDGAAALGGRVPAAAAG